VEPRSSGTTLRYGLHEGLICRWSLPKKRSLGPQYQCHSSLDLILMCIFCLKRIVEDARNVNSVLKLGRIEKEKYCQLTIMNEIMIYERSWTWPSSWLGGCWASSKPQTGPPCMNSCFRPRIREQKVTRNEARMERFQSENGKNRQRSCSAERSEVKNTAKSPWFISCGRLVPSMN